MFRDREILDQLRFLGDAMNRLAHRFTQLEKNQETLMTDSASILDKITANTSLLRSISTAADALKEGQATIAAEIQALKDQIAAGSAAPDFSALDAAADDQKTVIDGLNVAIPSNT